VKLVVGGVNAHGRSYVESTRQLPDQAPFFVWEETSFGNFAELLGRVAPDAVSPELEPPPGHFKWAYQVKPPQSKSGPLEQAYHMHTTRTVDFDFVVKGRMNCILDEEVVELEAGDFIVLKAASHRWVNPSADEETIIVYLLHRPLDPSI
jgi:mannose-6-phosphate isomerase-like protein (cupin superfamily)